jgi:hypothetical protein
MSLVDIKLTLDDRREFSQYTSVIEFGIKDIDDKLFVLFTKKDGSKKSIGKYSHPSEYAKFVRYFKPQQEQAICVSKF